MYTTFGHFVKRIREERGLSAEELAQRLSVPYETVNAWESGQMMPDEDGLCALADALEVNVPELEQGRYLYEDKDDAPPADQKPSLPVIGSGTKGRRILAFLLDGALAFIGMIVTVCAVCLVMTASGGDVQPVPLMWSMYGVWVLFDFRDWLGNGRSFGKRVFGLTVCDKKTADRPRRWQLLFRHFLRVDGVDLILILANGRTISDYIVGTVVISRNEQSSWKEQI